MLWTDTIQSNRYPAIERIDMHNKDNEAIAKHSDERKLVQIPLIQPPPTQKAISFLITYTP